MEIKLDTRADALYIRLKKGRAYKTMPTKDNYLVDVDKKGNVVGIEVLNYSQVSTKDLRNVTVSVHGERRRTVLGAKNRFVPA